MHTHCPWPRHDSFAIALKCASSEALRLSSQYCLKWLDMRCDFYASRQEDEPTTFVLAISRITIALTVSLKDDATMSEWGYDA